MKETGVCLSFKGALKMTIYYWKNLRRIRTTSVTRRSTGVIRSKLGWPNVECYRSVEIEKRELVRPPKDCDQKRLDGVRLCRRFRIDRKRLGVRFWIIGLLGDIITYSKLSTTWNNCMRALSSSKGITAKDQIHWQKRNSENLVQRTSVRNTVSSCVLPLNSFSKAIKRVDR